MKPFKQAISILGLPGDSAIYPLFHFSDFEDINSSPQFHSSSSLLARPFSSVFSVSPAAGK